MRKWPRLRLHRFPLFRNRRFLKYWKWIGKYLLPIMTVSAMVLMRLILRERIEGSPYLFFTLIVLFHSWYGGVYSGLLATFVSAVMINVFLVGVLTVQPLGHPAQLILLITYVFQCIVISYIIGRFSQIVYALNSAKSRLEFSQQRLRDIINSVFTLICIVQPDGRIIEVNTTFAGMFKNQLQDLIGRNILQTPMWNYDTKVRKRLMQALYDTDLENPTKYDDKLEISPGEFRDVSLSISAVDDDDDGVIDSYIISGIDITERKQYELDLEWARQSYERLVNSNIIGMIIGSRSNNTLEVNQALANLLGFVRTDLNSWEVWNRIVPFPDMADHQANLDELIRNGYLNAKEQELIHKDGHTVPVMISGVLIDDELEQMLILVVDLSGQKELQRKKDDFISIASHELKTPLTTIKGYTQLLSTALERRHSENLKYTNMLNKQIEKLTDLVNELLDVSRIQSGKLNINKTEFDLNELVDEAVKEAQIFTQQHQITPSYRQENLMISADRFRINQVLMNLLTNAIKYSPEANRINIIVDRVGEVARVSVQDYGKGIAEDKIPLLFEKFFQVYNNSDLTMQGLGLGLYISAQIVKHHGGNVNVESKLGKGSTFSFTLPLDIN